MQRTIALTMPTLVAWMASHFLSHTQQRLAAAVHLDVSEVDVVMPIVKLASKQQHQHRMMFNGHRSAALDSNSNSSRMLWRQLHPMQQQRTAGASLTDFFQWVKKEQIAGHISFWMK
jgi:hypothetical protein